MSKGFSRIAIALLVVIVLLRGANLIYRHNHTLPPVPQPNGYDEILSAASSIDVPPGDLSEMTSNQMAQIVAVNNPAIENIRTAFHDQSRVSLGLTRNWDRQHEDDVKNLKHLAVAFAIASKQATLNSNLDAAAECDLDSIELAYRMRDGGTINDGINSLIVEVLAQASLQQKLPQLTLSTCQKFAHALATCESEGDSLETIRDTQKNWSAKRFGLVGLVMGVFMRDANTSREKKFEEQFYDIHGRTQRLMIRLAARAYELDTGHAPEKISQLVPNYLPTAPKDLKTRAAIEEIPRPLSSANGER